MTKETPHLGLYQWTEADGQLRPTARSEEGERRHAEWLKEQAELRKTPEYQAYLERHGFSA